MQTMQIILKKPDLDLTHIRIIISVFPTLQGTGVRPGEPDPEAGDGERSRNTENKHTELTNQGTIQPCGSGSDLIFRSGSDPPENI